MDWAPVSLGIPATIVGVSAVVGRVIIIIYALRGTNPEDRPRIIQALGKMFRETRPELPPRRKNDDTRSEPL